MLAERISMQEEYSQPKAPCLQPNKGTILIAEDTWSTAYVASECLKFENYKVSTASTSEEVINQAFDLRPSAILLDLKLGCCNGLNVLSSLKGSLKDTRICVMSVIDSFSTVKQALKLGADDYIIKPLDPQLLVHKVNLLEGRCEEVSSRQYYPGNFAATLLGNDSLSNVRVIETSQYGIRTTPAPHCVVGGTYRCRSSALKKILQRNDDIYLRLTHKSSCEIYEFELVGLNQDNYKSLLDLLRISNNFTDRMFNN